MSQIVWLASYPKSGNTWLRLFFENLLNPGARPVDINSLSIGELASIRPIFDEFVGVEASDLSQRDIERYRPEVYRHFAATTTKRVFIKVHDAFIYCPGGEPMFPPEASRGTIYIVRNPLDVAASMANHYARSVDSTIRRMGSETAAISGEHQRLHRQLRQRLKSWSTHALSWTEQTAMPVCVLRYEDMIARPLATFSSAAEFACLDAESEAILHAIDDCSFQRLQNQERISGFKERLISNRPFFRLGQAGSWRQSLSEEQAQRIVDRHGEVMRRFGYLDANGEPTV